MGYILYFLMFIIIFFVFAELKKKGCKLTTEESKTAKKLDIFKRDTFKTEFTFCK